jgi:hypothetical protein
MNTNIVYSCGRFNEYGLIFGCLKYSLDNLCSLIFCLIFIFELFGLLSVIIFQLASLIFNHIIFFISISANISDVQPYYLQDLPKSQPNHVYDFS